LLMMRRLQLVCLLSLLYLALLVGAEEEELVEVTLQGLGGLRGKTGEARNKEKYYQFLGVPFAEPPTGENRFRGPVPVKSWEAEGVRGAMEFGPSCLQMPLFTPDKITGSEDCLYLNVYTRSLDSTAKKPVLVFIHGGAFIAGDSKRFTGEYLMEQDMVLVTLQYRLGPLGWLTTADRHAPGNYGLLDQILALRWVQDHITQFGGDKDLVTISGMSAGGASVNYLLLSPQTDGLFHRAIAMSGSALCWWANIPHQEKTAVKLASNLNCPTSSSTEMVDCLRAVPGRDMMTAQASLYHWHHDRVEKEPMTIWSPRPDLEALGEAVLPVEPHFAMEVGQIQPVPFLVGAAESEGVWQAAHYLTQDDVMSEFLSKFEDVARHSLGLVGQVSKGEMQKVLKEIKEFYLGALTKEQDLKKRLESVVYGMVNMMGDAMFNYPIDRMVKLHGNKEHSPVWVYQYNYKHNHSLAYFDPLNPGQVRKPELKSLDRATHAHEVSMMAPVFEPEMGPLSKQETEQSQKFVKFLMEFMVRGTPKHDGKYEYKEWEPVADGQLSYFVVGRYSGAQKGLPHQHRMKWWNSLPVFWKKNKEQAPLENIDPVEVVEELTKEELEELEAKLLVEEMKVKEEL